MPRDTEIDAETLKAGAEPDEAEVKLEFVVGGVEAGAEAAAADVDVPAEVEDVPETVEAELELLEADEAGAGAEELAGEVGAAV